jgi:hypothetical protein
MKKTNRRTKSKFRGLRPELNLKTRFEEIADMASYAHKLNEEELDWLNRFSEEYVSSNFNHNGNLISRTKKWRKECYDRNNARNRDIFTREKAQGTMNYLEDILPKMYELENEDEEKLDIETLIDASDS